MFHFSRATLWLLGIGACVHALVYRTQLPARMASHFDASGRADGWMARDAFLLTYLGTLLFVSATFAGVGWLVRRLPAEMISLPNKDYWLAPGRRADTAARFERDMSGFAVATNLLLIATVHLAFRANLTPEPNLGSLPMLLVGAYLLYTLVWTVALVARWSRAVR